MDVILPARISQASVISSVGLQIMIILNHKQKHCVPLFKYANKQTICRGKLCSVFV